ncbi:MAG: T9SS type A sorting domain-containing protein [Lentimicrobium sp.]|nr:T9SS type A sorting domain-containing protein [Lentimicrobium sp.]
MNKLTLFTAILMTANMLFAQIIHIPADYPTIQQGVNAANDGDTVLVHPGTYYENVNISNKSITLASLYLTTQDTSYITQTVIASVHLDGCNNARLSGLTLSDESSVGLSCWGSNAMIDNLIITGNSSSDWLGGGGVLIYDCIDLRFSDVIISDNIYQGYNNNLSQGGGIFCENSNPVFHNVTISDNTAMPFGYGGGISCWNSSPIFENCFFTGNSAKYGGAVYCADGSNPVFRNVVFAGNNWGEDWGMGSVLYLEDSWGPCFPSLINCTMTGNAGVHHNPNLISCGWSYSCPSNVTVTNSISWYNGNEYGWYDGFDYSTVSYSNVGCYMPGEGNINMEPLFLGTGEHPYQLSPGSPCIDTGTPDTTGLNLPLTDLMGNYRIWDGDGDGIERIDMGAYEFDAPIFVGIPQFEIANTKYEIQIFPNPFTTHTTIEFSLPKTSMVSILVFNAMGAKVAELHHSQLPAGQQQFSWDAGDLPKGLYFCRVQAGQEWMARKIIKH